jgi:3-oxoacyl-[acyl-carrier-protein] synthase-3
MKISGIGCSLPELTITNEKLTEFLETSDEWIKERTGIRKRQVVSSEELEDLAAQSALKALKDANVKAEDIDYIICSTIAYEYVTPSLGCIVQGIIGATNAASFDINAACTGFIYALDIAESLLKSHEDVENILIVCAEQPTRMVDWNDRSTAVLFGDAAGSVVVQKGDKLKSIKVSSKSNKDILAYKRCLEPTPFITKPEKTVPLVMLGQDVFKTAVSSSIADIKEVMGKSGITKDDVDLYVVHQANIRIIDAIRHHLGEVHAKFPHNVESFGNTSSASILLLLDELKNSGDLNEGDIVVLSAFGAGFTSGACILEW